MKRRLKVGPFVALTCALIINTLFSSANQAAAQARLQRPPDRNLEGTAVLPAGTTTLPVGMRLVIAIETPMSSKESQVGDVFKARIATPVIDANGKTLLSTDSVIVGRVTAVQPAKMPRRSGSIQLNFQNLILDDGRTMPIRGIWTNAEANDRKRFDNEGDYIAGSSTKRDVIISGGGAGAGAAIGAAAGGALAGAGIGAAAGITVALLMKGKNVDIEPGHRFALELSQPLKLSTPRPASRPAPRAPAPRPPGPDCGGNGVPVDVSEVRAERSSNGLLLILITAQTPSSGWCIFTNYTLSGSMVDVRMRGVPLRSGAPSQTSYPTAPVIVISDQSASFQRVVVHAKNGDRETPVGTFTGSISTSGGRPPTTTAGTRPRPTPRPTRPPSTTTPSTSAASLGTKVESEIEQLRYEFGSTIGVWINQDGTYDVIGQRKPTSDERQLLDGLGAQLTSVRAYNNSSSSSARQSSATKVQQDANTVAQARKRVTLSSDMNQKFSTMLQDTQALMGSDLGGPQPPPPTTTTPTTPTGPSTGPSTAPSSSVSQLASTVIGEITQCQYDFGSTVGVWINPDGTYDVIGQRKPTADEKQILDGLSAMLSSAKTINSTTSAATRSSSANKLRSDSNRVEQAWKRVKMSDSLNQKFGKMLQDSRALADMASR